MAGVAVPPNLVEAAQRYGRTDWLATLPQTVAEMALTWGLTLGEPFRPGGQTAWVAPARDATGAERVLKVAWQHREAMHEAAGLRVWAGNGAVLLHAARDLDGSSALLLERCRPGTSLARRPEPEQDAVVAGLLRRLWAAPATGFRPLQDMCDYWADEFEEKSARRGGVGLDAGLVRAGIELFRSLPASAGRRALLVTDLHAENVLAAERQPWLVIDPKPYAGDPTYDALQHMLNCPTRLHADPAGFADRMADLLDLERDRLLLWLFARCVQESPDSRRLADVARRIAPG